MPQIYDLEDRERKRLQRAQARPAILAGSRGEPQELSAMEVAGDIIAAPLRGIEGAAQDIYGLADTLAFDALADWEDRAFGESRTAVGGLIEGITNFGVGFAAAGFVPLGWTAKLGKLAPLARAATKGAVADFAVFDGHEARLSDLVQSNPALANPINDFLASDPDDAELEGRFKNALEGLGIGLFIDGMVMSVKALRAGRKARAAGKTADEVEAAMDKAAPPAKVEAAWQKGNTPAPVPPATAVGAPGLPAAAAAGPNRDVRQAALDFAQRKGITRDYPDPTKIVVDETRAKAIADAFEAAKHSPDDPAVQAAYKALGRDVMEQFDFITKEKGLKVEPWTGAGEPYSNSGAMAADIRDNNHLWFLPTDEAFGSGTQGVKHPMLAQSGASLGARPLKLNDVFRIVHDYFGHAAEGNQFGPRGEEVAWTLHAHLFSDEALPALTVETRGQNSWVNYGKHLRRADGSVPKKGDPDFVPLEKRPFAEQKAAILPEEFNAPFGRTPVGRSMQLLTTMDISPARAKELMEATIVREAPFSHATLLPQDLDPRVNPRKLTPAERFEQGMQETDLNLARYVGPDGGLHLVRVMEQVLEPLKGLGDASRRTLNQQEQAAFKEAMDMFSEGNPHRMMVALQKDVQELPAIMRRVQAYKIGGHAMAQYAYEVGARARSTAGTDKDLLEAIGAFRTLAEIKLGLKSVLGEQGRGLGANRIKVPHIPDLLDRAGLDAAMHELGGRKRAIDMIDKYRTLWESTTDPTSRAAKAINLAEGFSGRRGLGILNEYWYNSLLGRPTTQVVNILSNTLATIYRPIELMAGGALAGRHDIVSDGVRELVGLSESARESWMAMKAALTGGGSVLDPKALFSDIQDVTQGHFGPQAFNVDADTVHGQALTWMGRLIRYPSTVLTATDQFFQQLNYRAVAKGQLTKEALANPAIGRPGAGAFVSAEMDRLIHRGQAYGTAQLYARGVEDGAKNGLRSKVAVDEYAREYVRKALESPDHARLSALAGVAQRRAQEATFTAPLEPGTIARGYQELVLAHPILRLVTPFVRVPVNLVKAASDRTIGAVYGHAQLLAARRFPSVAASLNKSKNLLVRDMLSGDPRRIADARGRFALGMGTVSAIMLMSGQQTDDGMPLITGRGPSDKEQRQILEESGWMPYSIRVGNKYVSYARLDPFATVLGTTADIVNYIRFAADEDQGTAEDLSYGLAIALANNFTNKTYLSGLANFFDAMQDPQRSFPTWARTLAASFVPGQAAAAVSVLDPNLRDVRSIMDAARARWPGASDDLPPMRNVMGEPVKRAQSLGSGVSSILNAFQPILYREVSDDVVQKEFARLSHGFTPPKRSIGGLDLTTVTNAKGQNAYDRWGELHGEVTLGSRGNIRKALRTLMESKQYKKIPAQSTDELKSPRVGLVQNVIDDYRQQAFRQLIREYPELGAAQSARTQRKAQLLQGRETRPGLLNALQQPTR